jgi:hypothetical protein
MRLTGISLPRKNNRNIGDVAGITSLQLTHEDQFVTFQFSVLDFSHPERNQFRYKLENLKKPNTVAWLATVSGYLRS